MTFKSVTFLFCYFFKHENMSLKAPVSINSNCMEKRNQSILNNFSINVPKTKESCTVFETT